MARPKSKTPVENAPNNDWGTRETGIATDRTRDESKRPSSRALAAYRGKLHIPKEEVPYGWTYGWVTERLLNQDKPENVEEALHKGWRFVMAKDHPKWTMYHDEEYFNRGNKDGRIRRGGMIMMKLQTDDFNEINTAYREDGEEIRRQSSALTDYLGQNAASQQTPRFVVENESSYGPNYGRRG
jgi:hypothetical protein